MISIELQTTILLPLPRPFISKCGKHHPKSFPLGLYAHLLESGLHALQRNGCFLLLYGLTCPFIVKNFQVLGSTRGLHAPTLPATHAYLVLTITNYFRGSMLQTLFFELWGPCYLPPHAQGGYHTPTRACYIDCCLLVLMIHLCDLYTAYLKGEHRCGF